MTQLELNQEVIVLNKKYTTKTNELLYLNNSLYSKYKYIITDLNKNELFNCAIGRLDDLDLMKDSNGDIIANFKIKKFLNPNNTKLYLSGTGDNEHEQTVTFEYRPSLKEKKYTVEFFTLSGKKEILDVICNNNKEIDIFYGYKKKGGALISKITKESLFNDKCKIEVYPGIDKLFIVIITLHILLLTKTG